MISPGFIRDAGMFADSGRKAPAGDGIGDAEQVGAAVVEAIERDRGEITVAPLRARVLSRFAMHAPEISPLASPGAAPPRSPTGSRAASATSAKPRLASRVA